MSPMVTRPWHAVSAVVTIYLHNSFRQAGTQSVKQALIRQNKTNASACCKHIVLLTPAALTTALKALIDEFLKRLAIAG
jgi:hypothetical protein